MGSKPARKYRPPSITLHNWTNAHPKRTPKPEHGRFQLLQNTLTAQQLEQYEILFEEGSELERYMDLFSWREREEYIVNTLYLNCEESKQFCSTRYSAKVYVEHIPVRLSDIQDIPFPENLYLLLASLEGFQKLYQIAGYFRVIEDFVCMDRDGRVKVWFNSDLSKDTLSNFSNHDERRSDLLEHRMVDEIVKLIEQNTTQDSQAQMSVSDFIKVRQKGKGLGFKKCKEQILRYAQKYQVNIPNYFESVIGIFDDENDITVRETSSPKFNSEELRSIGPEPYYGNQVQVYNSSGSIANRNASYKQKVTNAINTFSSLNRMPSYQKMMEVDSRPNTSFVDRNEQQGSRNYTRAQSPLDQAHNINFTYKGTLTPSLGEKRSEDTKAAPNSIHHEPFPTLARPQHTRSNSNFEPMSKVLKNSGSLPDIFMSKRIVYSDCVGQYQLDAELIEDMIRYQYL